MRRRNLAWTVVAIVVALAVGGVVGFLLPHVSPPVADYPTNSLGLTYGEVGQLPPPDLVAVTTDEGVDGYVFELQLNGRPPADGVPNSSPGPRTPVPVYDLELQELLGFATTN